MYENRKQPDSSEACRKAKVCFVICIQVISLHRWN